MFDSFISYWFFGSVTSLVSYGENHAQLSDIFMNKPYGRHIVFLKVLTTLYI